VDFKPSYGTAGFRAEASLLPSTVFRCGLLIGLRARAAGQVWT
jgi:phosphoacetylglucosamine mutase